MAFPTVEVVFAPATERFRNNPRDRAIVHPTLEILCRTDGVIHTYYGVQHEDKETAYVLVAWESLAHHHALINDTVAYPPLVSAIQAIIDLSGIQAYHVAFTSEPWRAIGAPVLEIGTFRLHEGRSKERLEELVDAMAKMMDAAPEAAGPVSAAWGPTVEDDQMVGLVVGWTSVEAHWSFVTTDPTAVDLIRSAQEISTVNVTHVSLALYEE